MKPDDDLPEITDAMLDRAELRVGERLIRRGRPPLASPKQAIKLRLDPEVLAHFRKQGPGWQTRINETLRLAVKLDADSGELKAVRVAQVRKAGAKKRIVKKLAAGKKRAKSKRRA
jgi:uncharacterized protein (DUF4415 family)